MVQQFILANRSIYATIARIIKRQAQTEIAQLLEEFPAVGVFGPRQVGKTTLAEAIAATALPEPIYLDLETPSEAAKLKEPESYFELHKDKLIILDEIQRVPELFQILRALLIEDGKRG